MPYASVCCLQHLQECEVVLTCRYAWCAWWSHRETGPWHCTYRRCTRCSWSRRWPCSWHARSAGGTGGTRKRCRGARVRAWCAHLARLSPAIAISACMLPDFASQTVTTSSIAHMPSDRRIRCPRKFDARACPRGQDAANDMPKSARHIHLYRRPVLIVELYRRVIL